jgi:hypothetical protein
MAEALLNLALIAAYIITVVKVARALRRPLASGLSDTAAQIAAVVVAIVVSVAWPLIWIAAALRHVVFTRRRTTARGN